MEIYVDSLFDFGRCNTLNFVVGEGSQFELEWYRVWYWKVVGMDWGFQSELEWCSSALPFQDHLLSCSAVSFSGPLRACCFPDAWCHLDRTQRNSEMAQHCEALKGDSCAWSFLPY